MRREWTQTRLDHQLTENRLEIQTQVLVHELSLVAALSLGPPSYNTFWINAYLTDSLLRRLSLLFLTQPFEGIRFILGTGHRLERRITVEQKSLLRRKYASVESIVHSVEENAIIRPFRSQGTRQESVSRQRCYNNTLGISGIGADGQQLKACCRQMLKHCQQDPCK